MVINFHFTVAASQSISQIFTLAPNHRLYIDKYTLWNIFLMHWPASLALQVYHHQHPRGSPLIRKSAGPDTQVL